MPFLFEQIATISELLYARRSALAILDHANCAIVMTEDACQERRDHRLALQFLHLREEGSGLRGLKRHQKIRPRNIPADAAVTRIGSCGSLVENSLGGCGC